MEDCGGLDAADADAPLSAGLLDKYGSVLRTMRAPGADETQLLRSRKRNFSEAEVDALLRCVCARRKKLLLTSVDGVPRWQRSLMWKQVTEAVNVASGHQNRRTTREIKKKWSDIKIEAKKRYKSAAERGDDALLRPQDKRIICILDSGQNWDRDQAPGPIVKLEPGPGPTIIHVTTVKSEPQLSESEPSSSSPPASTEHAQTDPQTEQAKMDLCTDLSTECAQTELSTQLPIEVHMEQQTPAHCKCTEHAQRTSYTEHAQCAPSSDLMVALLRNQQQILETLRNMNDTFSHISSSLKDISHSLRR
ncbi:uncharacterized protein [Eucyclogobius newberryi]|uniref:uncharacterized protein n=1 Tax=Eucyclogobius newberryi TaxID=166745 RepID=UPI003B5A51D4